MKNSFLHVLLFPSIIFLLSSCLSFSHTTDVVPSNSPRILDYGQFGVGAAGSAAPAFLTAAGQQGIAGNLTEIVQQDTVFFRWGVSKDPRQKTEVGFNFTFNFSKAVNTGDPVNFSAGMFLPSTYLGGNASFVMHRQFFDSKVLSASYGLQAGAGPVFNYELMSAGENYGIFYGAVKISIQNQFTFLTNFKHHNVYWKFGPNLTVDVLSMSFNSQQQYFAVVEGDIPLKVGYLMSYSVFNLFMEAGVHPGLFVGFGQQVYLFIAPSFSLGFQFNIGKPAE